MMDSLYALLTKWEEELTRLEANAENPPRLGGAEESSETYSYAADSLRWRIDSLRKAIEEMKPSAYLVMGIAPNGDVWEHRTYYPAFGDGDPSGLDGKVITIHGKEEPTLGKYKVVPFYARENAQ
jgi:hypothetical protein